MPNSRDFVDYLLELARPVGRGDRRTMFGGHGLYLEGIIVAIVIDDTLYLKVRRANSRAASRRARSRAVRVRHEGAASGS